jgi:anthranilate phosphoribosyltransferase
VTVADKTTVSEAKNGSVNTFEIGPDDFGLDVQAIEHMRGGDPEGNAKIIRAVLVGKRRDAARSLVIVNSAAALYVGGAAESLAESARLAEESIDSGAAYQKLTELARATQ